MCRVQYSHPQVGINETKKMEPPRNIGDINAWMRQARKAIPAIPKGWFENIHTITQKTIIFELINNSTHERCVVVIARRD